MKRLAYAIMVTAMAAGTPARAQDLPTTEITHLDLSPYLQPGTGIRISGHALRRVGGYVVGVEPNTILVAHEKHVGPTQAQSIKLATVDTLWTQGNWLWPGVALGVSVGGFIGGAICVFGQADECTAFLVSVGAGIAAGAAVGLARKVWHRRYVRRDGGPVPTIGPWTQQ